MTAERRNEMMDEAVGVFAESARECFRVVVDGAVAAGRQNVEFAARTFDDGLEEFGRMAGGDVPSPEENVRFVRGFLERSVETFDRQAEIGRETARTLAEQSERQQRAFQALARQSVDAYMGFLFSPFSGEHARRKPEPGKAREEDERASRQREARNGENLPIDGYDQADVDRILGELDRLSAREVERIRAYEKQNKNRKKLVERLDHRLD